MNGGEAIGDIAQGALAARALEPSHGEAACLNCGTALIGSHCHACGQAAHAHKTLGAFFHDLLHGVFHFEGKIWRTLPLLAWRPGRLTREYIDGRRASYVSPIALFLFSVFLLFAVIHAVVPAGVKDFTPTIAAGLAQSRTEIADLTAERARRIAAGKSIENVDRRIASAKGEFATLDKLRRDGVTAVPAVVGKPDWNSSIPALDALLTKAQANPDLVLYKLRPAPTNTAGC